MVRAIAPALLLLVLSGCSGVPDGQRASLGPDPHMNSWTPISVPTSAQDAAPAEAQGECLRSASVMALWSCTKGKAAQ
jgi:hypothetical protein